MRKSQTMNCQEILLKEIRQILGNETSINEAISNVLQISYDAAHRRISMKSKFSIEETVTLCKEYGISMDNLFQQNDSLIVEKTKSIKTQADFKMYFEKSKEFIQFQSSRNHFILFCKRHSDELYSCRNVVF